MANLLNIETFCLGEWMTNCYVVSVADRCWVVDAGFEPRPMIEYIRRQALTPSQVVLTHAHVDHIAGLGEVLEAFPDLPILVHEAETAFLTDPSLNLSVALDRPVCSPSATGQLEHGQILELGGVRIEVRHTPGHSPGGVTLYQQEAGIAIVGDALFAGSIGRHDFPTSNQETLLRSIRDQLLILPDHTRVLPGHGPETTIGREKRMNPFLLDFSGG